ncbi:MAG: DNA/RNA nuclease SfsA [Deltaproteobacteria bacterium]|jgi:sugar fermentation stimulation protein A|nr:DNA/RNA nuclease SfsA [Deltaproteobacteria bacterium]
MISLPWPPLYRGTLLRRYKRFLADVRLESGEEALCHTANTGSMLECSEPGRPVFLSRAANPQRRCPYTWEMIQMPDGLVGVNTSLPNRLAALAARAGFFPGWPQKALVTPEARVGRSRLDLKLTTLTGQTVWVEVKNCSLVRQGVALFPDAVSQRGTRHLLELAELARSGDRAILLILAQRKARLFRPAAEIDPVWARTLRAVVKAGVEVLAWEVALTLTEAALGQRLEIDL